MILYPMGNSEFYTIIDDEDFEKVSTHEWIIIDGYAVCRGVNILNKLHRVLLNLEANDGKIVDHMNKNRLDNRKSNLRTVTHSQNMINRDKFKRKDTTSKYKGVRYLKRNAYYQCRIQKDKKPVTIGHYYDEIACANMYNHYAIKLHGEFARLNEVVYMSEEECDKYKVGGINNNE